MVGSRVQTPGRVLSLPRSPMVGSMVEAHEAIASQGTSLERAATGRIRSSKGGRKSVRFSPIRSQGKENDKVNEEVSTPPRSAMRIATPCSERRASRRLSICEENLLRENTLNERMVSSKSREGEGAETRPENESKHGSTVIYGRIRLSERQKAALGGVDAVSPVRHSARQPLPPGRVQKEDMVSLLKETNFCYSPNANLAQPQRHGRGATEKMAPKTVRRILF